MVYQVFVFVKGFKDRVKIKALGDEQFRNTAAAHSEIEKNIRCQAPQVICCFSSRKHGSTVSVLSDNVGLF